MMRGGIGGFLNGNPRRINPAHLTGPNAHGAVVLGKYNGVGFDMFGDSPGK